MKLLVSTLLFSSLMAPHVTFLLAAQADSAAKLQGDWRVQTSAAGRESTTTCSFTQQGEALSGTCLGSDKKPTPIQGKVEGKAVTWTYKTDSEAGPVTVVFKGSFSSADKLAGSILAVEFNVEGEFTAVPAKP